MRIDAAAVAIYPFGKATPSGCRISKALTSLTYLLAGVRRFGGTTCNYSEHAGPRRPLPSRFVKRSRSWFEGLNELSASCVW
jgi:hypothetical protein